VLETAIGKLLKEKNLTLSTAESCTGGYLAHLITSVPGASAYFAGSVISYSNAVKMNQLNVREETLREHGAVSEQTVREMVAGALDLLKTDLAIAVSGIAGPDGGTPEKPVGTVWIAVGNGSAIETRMLKLGKDRMRNIQYSAIHALNMLRLFTGKHY
jgi:PncC family amidohydrolase